jgi:hypothetical protein
VRRAVRRRGSVVAGVFALSLVVVSAGVVAAATGGPGRRAVPRAPRAAVPGPRVIVGHSVRNDTSRRLTALPIQRVGMRGEREANPNPFPVPHHADAPDAVRQTQQPAGQMPTPLQSFDGIAVGAGGTFVPPDTNGEVGATQYVESVNDGFEVFDKSSGASLYGPVAISTLWTGLGGVC